MNLTCSYTNVSSIQIVLHDLAILHSLYLGKTDELESSEWLEKRISKSDDEVNCLIIELLNHANYEFPAIWTKKRYLITFGIHFSLSTCALKCVRMLGP